MTTAAKKVHHGHRLSRQRSGRLRGAHQCPLVALARSHPVVPVYRSVNESSRGRSRQVRRPAAQPDCKVTSHRRRGPRAHDTPQEARPECPHNTSNRTMISERGFWTPAFHQVALERSTPSSGTTSRNPPILGLPIKPDPNPLIASSSSNRPKPRNIESALSLRQLPKSPLPRAAFSRLP